MGVSQLIQVTISLQPGVVRDPEYVVYSPASIESRMRDPSVPSKSMESPSRGVSTAPPAISCEI